MLKNNISAENNSIDSSSNDNNSANTQCVTTNTRKADLDPKIEEKRKKDRERYKRKKETDPEGLKLVTKINNERHALMLNMDPEMREIINANQRRDNMRNRERARIKREMAKHPHITFGAYASVSELPVSNDNNDQAVPQNCDDPELEIQAIAASLAMSVSSASAPTSRVLAEEQFDEIPMLQNEDQFQRAFTHKTKSLTVKTLITQIQNSRGIEPTAKALKIEIKDLQDLLLKHFILIDETTQNNFFHLDKARIIFEFLWTLSPNEINGIFGQSLDQPISNNQWGVKAHPLVFQSLYKTKQTHNMTPTYTNATISCRRSSAESNNNNQDEIVVISSRKCRERSMENPLKIVSNTVKRKQNEITANQQEINESIQVPKKSSNNHSKRFITFAVMEKKLGLMTVKEFIDLIRKGRTIYSLANRLNYTPSSVEQFLLDKFIFVDAASQKPLFHSNRGDMIYRFFRNLSKKQLETLFGDNFNQPIADNKWRFHSEENNFEIFNKASPKYRQDTDITIKCQRIRSNSTSPVNSFNQDDLVSITFNACRNKKAPSSSTSFNSENSTSQTTSNLFHHSACPTETTQTNESSTLSMDTTSFPSA